MAAVDGVRVVLEDGPVRKKPKISELPLSSAKRASIDGLLHIFKKKGEFDALRKKTYKQFEDGDSKSTLLESLRTFTDDEIEREPLKYLAKDRRLAAPLLEGAAARANIYPTTEEDISRYIAGYLDQAEIALREIRRKEIGEDAAKEEETKGAKSDDAYGAEASVRRDERAKQHVLELKLKKKKEREEKRKLELEALEKRAAELTKEKERLEREQKRRTEREALRKKQKEAEQERLKKFQEEQERLKKEKEEKQKALDEENARRKKEEEAAEAKRLEEQAMRLLLREGERMAEKTGRNTVLRGGERSPSPDSRHYRGLSRRDGRTPRSEEERLTRAKSPKRLSVRDDGDRRRDTISVRDRSRSPGVRSVRKHHDDSRSPPRRSHRDRSRSRSPPRRSYRDRDVSPPKRKRSRSRSPPDIDRYVPSSGRADRRDDRRDDRRERGREDRDRDSHRERDHDYGRDRERDRDRDRARDRGRDDRDRDRGRDDRDRDRGRDDRDKDHDRDRRRTRDSDDRPKTVDIDRYVPGGGRLDSDRRRSTRDKSRSRERH